MLVRASVHAFAQIFSVQGAFGKFKACESSGGVSFLGVVEKFNTCDLLVLSLAVYGKEDQESDKSAAWISSVQDEGDQGSAQIFACGETWELSWQDIGCWPMETSAEVQRSLLRSSPMETSAEKG